MTVKTIDDIAAIGGAKQQRPTEEVLPHLAHRFTQIIEDAWVAKNRPVTLRQVDVLYAVLSNEGASQTGLVDATSVDRSTLADIVRRLYRRALLTRRRTKEDARAYAVRLTDSGKRELRASLPKVREVTEEVLAPLSQTERRQLESMLRRIVEAAQDRAEVAA